VAHAALPCEEAWLLRLVADASVNTRRSGSPRWLHCHPQATSAGFLIFWRFYNPQSRRRHISLNCSFTVW
jgi:hypothetical protein